MTEQPAPIAPSPALERLPVFLAGLIGLVVSGVAYLSLFADQIPRLLAFALLGAVLLLIGGIAAWAYGRQRPQLADGLLALCSVLLLMACPAIAQRFDLPGFAGDLLLPGLAIFTVASGSRAPAAVALIALAFGYFDTSPSLILYAGLAAVVVALAWPSALLARAGAIASALGACSLAIGEPGDTGLILHGIEPLRMLAAAAGLAVLAIGLRLSPLGRRPEIPGILTWWTAGALLAYGSSGLRRTGLTSPWDIAFLISWLLFSGLAVFFGWRARLWGVVVAGTVSLSAALTVALVLTGVAVTFAFTAFFGLTTLGLVLVALRWKRAA